MGEKPLLQIAPRGDLIADWGDARLDLIEVSLQHLVHQAFFVPEVVIELPLAGVRCLDDFIGAGGARASLME
jgi:hypothetical protein